MPSSRHVGMISSSGSRVHSEYSVCSALIGHVLCARRMVEAAASESPRQRTLPSSTSRHCAHRLFDGYINVNPMLVVKVDCLHVQPPQTGFASLTDVFRPPVDSDKVSSGISLISKFRCQNNLIAPVPNGLAHQFLVMPSAVNIGRVEEIHTQIERAVDDVDRFLIVTRSVKLGHSHAAQPNG